MVNVTFWTCVKIGFGITLGYQLAKELLMFISKKIDKMSKRYALKALKLMNEDNPYVKKYTAFLISNGIITEKKQPIGFQVTNKKE